MDFNLKQLVQAAEAAKSPESKMTLDIPIGRPNEFYKRGRNKEASHIVKQVMSQLSNEI